MAAEPTQTIWLGPGDDRQLIFDNLKQPELTIAKVDAADSTTPIPGTVFRIEAIDGDYQHDVTTGQDGTVTLRVQPGTYKITELAVPAPYYLPDKDADREQTITLNAGDDKEVTFKDHKAPELTIYKVDSITGCLLYTSFTGTPMEPVAEEQSQSGGLNWLMVALPALAALGAGTGGTYFFMKRKERKMYEELAESNDAAAGHHSDDGDPGTGGGV